MKYNTNNDNINTLIEDGFLNLSANKWKEAKNIFNKVIEEDPQNPYGYLGRLLEMLRISSIVSLNDSHRIFSASTFFKKALKYADNDLKKTLESYDSNVKKNVEEIYNLALNNFQNEEYGTCHKLLNDIGEYKDATTMRLECLNHNLKNKSAKPTNVTINHDQKTKKENPQPKTLLKKAINKKAVTKTTLITVGIILVIIIIGVITFPMYAQKAALKKLIFLQENTATYSEYDTMHNAEVKKAIIDIGLSANDTKKAKYPLSEENIAEFINMYSIETLFDLFTKIDKYVDEVNQTPLMWCVSACPDKFINILELEENIDGYYKENPNAYPTSREEPLKDNENYVEKYKVKYYGDFAIAEEETYRYSKGYLGWKNGVFIDESESYYVCYYTSVYYKGEDKGSIYYRCPKYKEEASMMSFDIYAYVREDTGELYFLFTDNEGKTNTKIKLFAYEYR